MIKYIKLFYHVKIDLNFTPTVFYYVKILLIISKKFYWSKRSYVLNHGFSKYR
jgi:hypothetical protein